MGRFKVCVYAIAKNEEKFVYRWMDSMSEADVVVVTDTGSTDGTVNKLRELGAVVYVDKIIPWRFDTARNVSLNHVPDDTDICVCTDLDEIFNKGWRKRLESAWRPETDRGKYLYNWSVKPDGSPGVQFTYFKVHTRKNFIWKYPIHEYAAYTGEYPEKEVFIDGMVLSHYPDSTKSRSSYLPLLILAVNENPNDDRMNYYLGREFMYSGKWQKCIDTLTHYLTLKKATWNEERSAAMRWIAFSYSKLGNSQEAYRWYYRAIAESPAMRDPYIEFAKLGYLKGDWPLVFYMVDKALKITNRSETYVNMEYSWDYTPYDLGAISCYWLQMYEKSLEYAKKAISMCPNDERLKSNLNIIENKLTQVKEQESGFRKIFYK